MLHPETSRNNFTVGQLQSNCADRKKILPSSLSQNCSPIASSEPVIN